MKKNLLLALIVTLVAMFAAACGAPTPEKLCAKVEGDKQKECTESLTAAKKAMDELDESLWPELAKCLDGKDLKKEEDAKACYTEEFAKKMAAAAEKKAKK